MWKFRLRHVLALALVTALLAPAATVAGDGDGVTIAAAGFQFTPAALAIPLGTPVTWDGVLLPHTVTTAASLADATNGVANDGRNQDEDANSFRAGLAQGQQVTHVFTEPGTYYYFCEPHASLGMVGVIQVVG